MRPPLFRPRPLPEQQPVPTPPPAIGIPQPLLFKLRRGGKIWLNAMLGLSAPIVAGATPQALGVSAGVAASAGSVQVLRASAATSTGIAASAAGANIQPGTPSPQPVLLWKTPIARHFRPATILPPPPSFDAAKGVSAGLGASAAVTGVLRPVGTATSAGGAASAAVTTVKLGTPAPLLGRLGRPITRILKLFQPKGVAAANPSPSAFKSAAGVSAGVALSSGAAVPSVARIASGASAGIGTSAGRTTSGPLFHIPAHPQHGRRSVLRTAESVGGNNQPSSPVSGDNLQDGTTDL